MNSKRIIKKLDIVSGIYALWGFIFGSVTYYILLKSSLTESNKGYFFLIWTIFSITNLLLIKIKKSDTEKLNIKFIFLKTSLISSIILASLYYLIIKTNIENYPSKYYYSSDYEPYMVFSLILTYIILIIYIKSFISLKERTINKIFSYDRLINLLIEYSFKINSSLLILGGVWIILGLWAVLFKLIDINFFYNLLFDNTYSPLVLSTTVYFVVYGMINKLEVRLNKFLSRLSALQFFLEIISAFLILFIVFLPIMGPKKIFNTGYSSVIMLLLNTIGLILIQFINFEKKDIAIWRKWLITSFVILEPIFSFLAMYSIMIRINQYGFTTQRFIAFIIILIFNILNLSYFYAVIKGKLSWRVYIKKQTPYLTVLSVFILLLTITPLLNPYEISVRSQISKFGNNIEKLDLRALKFKLSIPGKDAFKKLKIKYKNDKKAMKRIKEIEDCKSYWNCNKSHSKHKTSLQLKIHPNTEKQTKNLEITLNKYYKYVSNYRNSNIIIKDFLPEYKDKEIVVVNRVWIMGNYKLYQAIFVRKTKSNEYELLREDIFENNNKIDYENFKLMEKK